MRLNNTLDTFDVFKGKDLFVKVNMKKNVSITASKGRVFIDKNGKRIFNHGTLPDKLIGDKLVFIEKKNIFIADLSGL
jgi:hypothetical protein